MAKKSEYDMPVLGDDGPPDSSPDMMADEESEDEGDDAKTKACHELAGLLGVSEDDYDTFKRLLKVATGD